MQIFLLLTIAIGSLAVAIFFAIRYFRLTERFKPVISVDDEAERVRKEIDRKKTEAEELLRAAKSKAAVLGTNYEQAKQIFDRLEHETALLQENLEDLSFGLYKPHYSFDTPESYKAALEKVYEQKKALIHADKAADYSKEWTVNGSKREGLRMTKGQLKLMLRAFNGECDAAIAKVAWNNVVRMEERITKAHEAINKLGAVNKICITTEYLEICLAELRLAHEYELKE